MTTKPESAKERYKRAINADSAALYAMMLEDGKNYEYALMYLDWLSNRVSAESRKGKAGQP